jgi:hypothetical protein
MMKRAVLAAAASLMFATPAFAMHCPSYMAKIDEALAKNPSLTAEQLAEVQTLRQEGEALHNSGKHAESEESLHKAMDILGVEE